MLGPQASVSGRYQATLVEAAVLDFLRQTSYWIIQWMVLWDPMYTPVFTRYTLSSYNMKQEDMFAVLKDTIRPNSVTACLQSLIRHRTDMNTIRMAKSLTVLVYIPICHSLV